ncbi:amidohydrolase [Succinispira mobilis]|uniref:amidohydrolase n=1 Tax=Succinispira mobilis TaxID=78120 RepID=UPI00035C4F01|nr:amidohydrolase [Succinispira mobilis]
MLALTGATIYSMHYPPIEDATILIEGKKIKAIGDKITLPHNCKMIDVSGKVITPGLIDAHTHLGIFSEGTGYFDDDLNEASQPLTPGLSVLDAINPRDIGLTLAYQAGVTTVMVAPGSANPIGGQCCIIKTKAQSEVDSMLVKQHAGLKVSFGENPKHVYRKASKMPYTRMATANLIRETFLKAREYLAKQNDEDFEFKIGYEAIAKVMRKEMPLRAHAHRADDIVTAIRIAKEFDLQLIIEHATEAHLIPDVLAREEIPVVLGPLMHCRTKPELTNVNMRTPYILAKYGIPFAVMSDHPVTPSEFLPIYAALSTKYGLDSEQALRAITIDAAKILGIDKKVGSLQEGLDADLVVWSDFPLHIDAHVEMVMVNGELEDLTE